MVLKFIRSFFYVFLFLVGMVNPVISSDLSIPNSFSSGSATSASQMNANFAAVESAVDDNHTRITALEGSSDKVFQGFSATTMDGTQGIRTMVQACDASWSGSKICTTVEYQNSKYNGSASNLSGNAWILPVLTGAGTGTGSSGTPVAVLEVGSGKTVTENVYQSFNCEGWQRALNSDSKGMVVSAEGKITTSACTTSLSVACCK